MAKMDERLETMVERYNEINELMMRADIVSNRKEMAKLGREQNELTPIVETYGEYKQAKADLEDAQLLLAEEDISLRRFIIPATSCISAMPTPRWRPTR